MTARTASLRLVIDTARARDASGDLDRVENSAKDAARAVDKLGDEAAQSGRQMRQFGAGAGDVVGRLTRLAAGVFSVRAAFEGLKASLSAADEFASLENRLRLVIDAADDLESVQKRLLRVSQETFSGISETTQLYQRIAGGTEALELSQARLISLTETVNKAITLSGQAAGSGTAALLQFGQALESGVLSGDEFKSIRENAPALAKAIADGLGVTRGELRKLAEDQALTTEVVVGAIEKQKSAVDAAFGKFDQTFDQTRKKLAAAAKTLLAEAFGPLNQSNIVIFDDLANALGGEEALRGAREFGEALVDVLATAQGITTSLAAAVDQVVTLAGVAGSVVFPFSADEFAAEFAPLFADLKRLGELQQEIRKSRIVAADVERAAFDQLGEKLEQIKALGAEIRIGDLAIQSVDEFKAAVDEAGNSIDLTKEKLLNLNKGRGAVTVGVKGEFVNLPTIDNGEIIAAEEAIRRYRAGVLDAAGSFDTLNEAIEAARTGAINIGEIRFEEGFDKAIDSAEELQKQIRELGLTAEDVFRLIAKQGVFAFPNPQGRDARQAFSPAAFKPDQLIVRTEEEQKALAKLAEAAAKARREVEDLFASEITEPFQDSQALLEAAQISDAALTAAKERLEIEEQIAIVAKSYAEAGLKFSAELENSAREQLKAIKEADREIARISARRTPFIESTPQDALERQLSDLVRDLGSDRSLGGLSQDEIARGFEEGVNRYLAPQIREAIDAGVITGQEAQAAIEAAKNDLIKNDDKNAEEVASRFEESIGRIGSIADIGSQIFDSLTEGVLRLREGDGDIGDIAGAVSSIGRGVGDALQTLSAAIPELKPVAAAVTAVGEVAGFVESAINFFRELFGKRSGFFARATLDFDTGTVFGRRQRDESEDSNANAQGRDTFLDAVNDVVSAIQDITGALSSGELAVEVNSREGIIISGEGFGPRGGPANPQAFTDPDLALDAAVRLAVESLEGGNQALVEYARAALQAGRDTQDLVDGLQALQGAFSLQITPLSEIEKQLKSIDDVINPVIADLQALGQSIAGIQQVARDAARSVGRSFIDDVQQTIIDIQNGTLGDYNRLLKEIEQRQKDALTLFQRGAITTGELANVDYLNALQAQQFFADLSPDELASLGDFFGLLGDIAGEAVVAMTRLTQGIVEFTDEVVETVERLTREAAEIQSSVDRARDTRRDILREFSPLTAGEQLRDLRGELVQIFQSVQAPDASAEFIADQINLASDLAKEFVDISADLFGPTGQFGQNRDFATSILQQIADAGQAEADERLSLAEAANAQVAVLNEIRDEFTRPDPSLSFLQSILDENRLQNTILEDLLQQYLTLAGQQALALSPTALQAAADAYLANGGGLPAPQPSTPAQVDVVDAILRSQAEAQANANAQSAKLAGIQTTLDDIANDVRQGVDFTRVAVGFR